MWQSYHVKKFEWRTYHVAKFLARVYTKYLGVVDSGHRDRKNCKFTHLSIGLTTSTITTPAAVYIVVRTFAAWSFCHRSSITHCVAMMGKNLKAYSSFCEKLLTKYFFIFPTAQQLNLPACSPHCPFNAEHQAGKL